MKKTLKSGVVLDITRSPFITSHKLFKAVAEEIKEIQIKLGLKEGQTFTNLFDIQLTDEALNTLKNSIATLIASQKIEDCFWECCERCLYGTKKITKDLFNDEKACEDYYEVYQNVIIENVRPFFHSLGSVFPALGKQSTSVPKL